jgi:tetratricopeptide (TPR) repeat protein
MVQNFHLVWLDKNIDEVNSKDCRNSITKLRQVVNTVNAFTDLGQCVDFINGTEEEEAFVICSGALGETLVRAVHNKPQVSAIYILCKNKTGHEQWAKDWPKVNGVYTDIKPICEALKRAAHDCDHNSISIRFIKTTDGASNQNLDTLDRSFMYTQILKEILFTIDFDQIHINEFLTYCREQFAGNTIELKNIDKLEKEYRRHQPIWWYTYDSFIYSMINRALRLMEVDLIIKMGFFVRDLHNHIAVLHSEQYVRHEHSDSFTLYRGQGLSQADFNQLKNTEGGLLAFNNFLSTSQNPNVCLEFARRTVATSNLVGVLFIMKIDPSISATPFANVGNISFIKEEEEILFSMHSVFRIGQVKKIDEKERLWQLDLTLTSDDDPQLHALTERMREETYPHLKGWDRLGMLLMKLGHYKKAEELYEILILQTTNESEKTHLYHMLGMVKNREGKYVEAVEFYERSIRIKQKILSPTHSDLAASYSCLGVVYKNMGDYSKALSYYREALEIWQNTHPPNHPDLATSYNNIGAVYEKMGEYSQALSSHEKALEIRQKTLPPNHLDFAQSYNNIGVVYYAKTEYSQALSSHEKALEIRKKTLPPNHRDLATSYNNIGAVYYAMREYSKALSYYENSLQIDQKSLPANHPHLAASYENIGAVYNNTKQYSKALSHYEKALEIKEKTLPANHPDLAFSYNNIGWVYRNIGDYSKALSYCEDALNIWEPSLPLNHPHLEDVRQSIEIIKKKL